MSGILRLESLTKGNTLKQGDKTPLKYRLFDADGEKLNIAGKSAKVRLVYPDFLTLGYEKDGLTVAQDDTVTFTIDKVIPSRIYHVEIIVDGQFIFPSRADESKFTVDKSSLGTETNIIEIVGKDVLIQAVKSQVDTELQPLVTSLESAQQAEAQRVTAESTRVSAEEQRKTDHANRSAELARKADKVIIRNLVLNGDFDDGLRQWTLHTQFINTTKVVDGKLHVYAQNSGALMWPAIQQPSKSIVGHINYFRVEVSEMASNSIQFTLQDKNRSIIAVSSNGVHSAVRKIDSGQTLPNLYLNHAMGTGDVVNYKVDNIMSIDLTETFGAGNEPSKEEMDELIKVTGYIDGEYALNNKEMLSHLMKGIREKANKKQEDWITPTLINGWQTYPDVPFQYRKDSMGMVNFRGRLNPINKTDIAFCILPVSYRPSVLSSLNWGNDFFIAVTKGGVCQNFFNTWVSLDGFSYEAVVN